ncbi:PAS domain S-box protein [Leptolyngbya sp. FACHB-8]|uniref:PAS domain S-box protein n=1 Tax=unclassified Leptolyngbya TaxID=2650499 RepID=UPI0016824EDB|nr:PAS domain S-box protein [Leptolyngbya sp. FACHB-8]MBD1914077.1 PAS domain S-box protein [Leptolyngbya sp. FACHB-8]
MKRDAAGKFVNNWNSETKQRVSISLTRTAWRSLDKEAQKRGISRSEVIEQFARGLEVEHANRELPATIPAVDRTVATILESITDAFVAFDRDWHYTYANHAAAQILHKTPEELIGKHVWNDVFPELVGGVAYEAMHRAFIEQVPVAWEEFGEPVQCWLEVNAYPSSEGIAVYFRNVTERKRAEAERERLLQELERERAQFKAVLQQMPAGVLIAEATSGKLMLANEQAKKIVGYDYEESHALEDYVSNTPFQAFHPNGQIYALDEYPLSRSLRTGEVIVNEELELRYEDGDRTLIAVNSSPILDKQGQILAAVVVFQNITERQRTEALLQEQRDALENQQKWLEMVLDLMPTPMVFIEPETAKIIFSNRIANELAGGDLPKNKSLNEYSDAYYCTDVNGDRIPAERMPAVLIARGERLEDYEMNWYTPGGIRSTLCWGEILPAMYGHPAIGIGMFQDVTRLKQIEENLRQTEERLQLALSSAQMFAWDTDLRSLEVVCSPNAVEIWGFHSGPSEAFHTLMHPDDRQAVLQAVERTIAGDSSFSYEYRVMSPDGQIRWLRSQGRVYLDEAGQAIRMIGVSANITEVKQIEAERDRLLEQEQAARRLAESERQRLRDILMQVPAMFAVLSGPNHVFELANAKFLAVSGRSEDIIGKAARDAFPEMEGQDFFEIHDHVYQTGEVVRGDEYLSRWDPNGDGNLVEGFFNLVFLPLRDIDGCIDSVLIHGIEVTDQVQARRQAEALLEELQRKEKQQQFLIELNDVVRVIQDSKEIVWHVATATGQHFNVTRCTYAEINATQEYLIVDRDYCNGVMSIAGRHHIDSFGPALITELKQGKTIVVDDVDRDPRTAGSGATSFDAIQTKSLLCVPFIKEGRFVALFVLHHIAPRRWTEEDVELMERIATKTWLAVERSRAEAELRESEAHLQLALKVGRMGTWDWNMQMNTVAWSDGQFAIMGLQASEHAPSYDLWAKSVHPDDLAATEAVIQQAMQERTEFHHEYRTLWPDSSLHWTEARGRFTYNADQQPTRMIGVLIDITERKQAEQEREQLLERERIARSQAEAAQQQLATIVDTSPIGLALLDADQRFIAINEALAEINGLPREHHLGKSVSELFGEVDPKIVEVIRQIYATGNPLISPNLPINTPGHGDRRPGYYNVYYLPTVDSNHQVEGLLAYIVDVTERFKLERAQQFLSEASAVLASSLDYQTTLEQVAQLTVPGLADWCTVHIVEEDGRINQIVAHIDPAKLEWAHQLREKYPLNPNDARGAAFTLRTGQPDFAPDIPDELLVQAARDSEHLEILRQVGFSSFMSVPLQTQARIIGVISFISAESGRRYTLADVRLAEELARRASLAIENAQLYQAAQHDRAKAEAANRIKDEFLAVLSHELRSPLNPILGWTKLLRSKQLDSTKTEHALETIERNAKLQAQLIEDLLDVSRILQGKMALNTAPVNLAATINAALETVNLAAEAKHIQIQTVLAPISGSILGDANRLQQVIWNLLSNAVKFTPEGGQVAVKLEQVELENKELRVQSKSNSQFSSYAQITVADTGKGISPKFLPHVFDYFRQEDGTTTRRFGGLGLGLAIVRQLTELHGGTVWAESPGPSLGATFIIRLPINRGGQKQSFQTKPLEKGADLTGIQVLVVDDDADMRELASFILTNAGAQVMTADSAMQVLPLLNQSLPDLLLCDIGMPEMDGYSLIRQIRKWAPEQGGSIPAIALTAYAGEINQQQALAAGFQMHISKPIEPEELVQAIAQLVHSM